MRARACVLWACLFAALCAPSPAAAQGKPAAASKTKEPVSKEKERALTYIKSGNRAGAAGQWDDAYAELSIAYKLYPDWESAGALGKAAHRTKHHAEAVRRLSQYLREAPAGRVSAKQRADAELWIADAKSKTGTLAITAPAGAEISVDGEPAGTAPLAEPIHVDPGKHTVEVKQGATVDTRDVEVAAGASAEVTVAAPPPPEEKAPPKPPEAASEWPRMAVLIGGSALAVGGIVAGGVSLGVAADKGAQRQEASNDPNGREAAQGFAVEEAEARNAALWTFVGGGLAAAGTAVFYFTTRGGAKAPVKGAVGVTPAGPVVWVHGHF